jgi:hypothetical protein
MLLPGLIASGRATLLAVQPGIVFGHRHVRDRTGIGEALMSLLQRVERAQQSMAAREQAEREAAERQAALAAAPPAPRPTL